MIIFQIENISRKIADELNHKTTLHKTMCSILYNKMKYLAPFPPFQQN